MIPVSAEFLDALSSSQQVSVRADLRKAGVTLYSGLPVTSGSVTVTRTQVASRRLDCVLAPELPLPNYLVEPVYTGSLVGVFGHEVKLYWTLHFAGGGSESVPLGVFRIDKIDGSLVDDQPVSLSASSHESYVVDDVFIAPRTLSGPSTQSLIAALLTESMSGDEVVMAASRDARVPTTPVSGSRWDAIKLLADSIAATVRCDAFGRFVVSDAPTLDSQPVWTVKAGSGGVLVQAGGSSDRSQVRNAWVVQGGSPSSDSTSIQGVVYDDDPTSPTLYGDPADGAFGRCPGVKSMPTFTSVEQCQHLGRTLLAQSTGASTSLDLSLVPNPALEVGDVIDVIPDMSDPAGSVRRHMVDSINFDLTPGGGFAVQTRDLKRVDDE